ncbi:hypothetical protein [Salana multivorans]
MDSTTWIILAVVALVILAVVGFVVVRGRRRDAEAHPGSASSRRPRRGRARWPRSPGHTGCAGHRRRWG